jgi:hypothetical protein
MREKTRCPLIEGIPGKRLRKYKGPMVGKVMLCFRIVLRPYGSYELDKTEHSGRSQRKKRTNTWLVIVKKFFLHYGDRKQLGTLS